MHDVALLRLVAQRLVGPAEESARDVVGWMTAMQAQDLPGATTSVTLRSERRTREDVFDALRTGAVVRSWPMRGTLHLVPAQDLRWMLGLTSARMVKAAERRRADLGLDDATRGRASALAGAALAGGRALRRGELYATWEAAGISTDGQRGIHLLGYLCQTGLLGLGPMRGLEQCVVLLADWSPDARVLERDEALGELALRYFRSHGPATDKDLAWWTKLTLSDVRTGLAVAQSQLAVLEVDGVSYFMDPTTPDRLAACRGQASGVLLLPGFDEFLLGYQDRSAALAPEHAQRVVPGGNGMFLSTVVADGSVVGTWKRARQAGRTTIKATPFSAFTTAVAEAIDPAFQALPDGVD
ncbi:MAG: winged helix DNA-binding domain-containing protein [Nocardioidaceae bacterium]